MQQRLITCEETLGSTKAELAAHKVCLAARTSALNSAQDALTILRDGAKAAATAAKREAATREMNLRAKLDALRTESDGTRRELEIELASWKEKHQAAMNKAEEMRCSVESSRQAEASAAAAAQAAQAVTLELRTMSAAELDSVKKELSDVQGKAAAATEAATRATRAVAEKEAWATEAVAAVKSAAASAAAISAEKSTASVQEARVQARSEALEQANADRKAHEHGVMKKISAQLQQLGSRLDNLLESLDEAAASFRSAGRLRMNSSPAGLNDWGDGDDVSRRGRRTQRSHCPGDEDVDQDGAYKVNTVSSGDGTLGVVDLECGGLRKSRAKVEDMNHVQGTEGDDPEIVRRTLHEVFTDDVDRLVAVVKKAEGQASVLRGALDVANQEVCCRGISNELLPGPFILGMLRIQGIDGVVSGDELYR